MKIKIKNKASLTTYFCILISILFAYPTASESIDIIFRMAGAIIMLTAYIGFIKNERPKLNVLISASIPSLGWAVIEFLWHAWMVRAGYEKWQGGFLITIGGPAEVPVETFILFSLIIIQSYFVTIKSDVKKMISYVALSGMIFGFGSYLLQLFGLIEGSLIMKGITASVFKTPLKIINTIATTAIICVFLYCIFLIILYIYDRIFAQSSND